MSQVQSRVATYKSNHGSYNSHDLLLTALGRENTIRYFRTHSEIPQFQQLDVPVVCIETLR